MIPLATPTSLIEARQKSNPITADQCAELDHDYEADLLDLSPSWKVLRIIKTECSYEVIAQLLTPPPVCPRCRHSQSLKPNGTLEHSLIDQSIHYLYLRLHFLRQRYLCACGRSLLQPLADTFKGHSITKRAARQIAASVLIHSYDYSADEVGVSAKTAKNVFADVICELEAARTISLPEVLGIDGVCVGQHGNKKTYCLLTDISNHDVLELLKKSTELELARFLKQVPGAENLKVVVIDMARGFLVVIQKLFPHALVVIDAYHVLRLLNDAITEVVKTKQRGLSESEIEQLMRGGNRFLLLKRRSELSAEEKEQLRLWSERAPEFKAAFDLKEEIFDIWRINNRAEAESRYDAWLKSLPKDFEKPFNKFTGAVRRWRKYIFNYFDCRITNAYTESRNRDIKTLQRTGRRTSFTVLRARLLYADAFPKHQGPLRKIEPNHIREVVRRVKKQPRDITTRDPKSYLVRMDAARKSKNEFSKLLRPPLGWDERFNQYSCYSDEENPWKWNFLW
jgi:transposase